MIEDEGKYYLYRHIREDKNEVFYIGIGTKNSKVEYKRAFAKDGTNCVLFIISSVIILLRRLRSLFISVGGR